EGTVAIILRGGENAETQPAHRSARFLARRVCRVKGLAKMSQCYGGCALCSSRMAKDGVGILRAPLSGRRAELRVLEAVCEECVRSAGARVFSIVGSQGIGKTRLVREFETSLRDRKERSRIYFGTTRRAGQAFGPLSGVFRARFGLADGMAPDAQKTEV